MRESIGNALLLNLVIVFISLVMLFFVGILSYSKAYRVKNRIVEIIEKYEGYESNEDALSEIEVDLKTMGYFTTFNDKCSSENLNQTTYKYCVYRREGNGPSYYYEIVTYVHFGFPIIGDYITIPVKGETKILGKNYSYE